jgi:hypothetical protein
VQQSRILIPMWPFRSSGGNSIAVMHVSAQEVSAGLVWHETGKKPALCATARAIISKKEGEAPEASLERALTEAGDELVRTGAPVLRSIAGSGSIDRAIVGLQCPWMSGTVETTQIQPEAPFTYTRSMEHESLDEDPAKTEGRFIEKRVAATLLNGYLTKDPYGKRAKHAELVVYVSKTSQAESDAVTAVVRRTFHLHTESQVSFCYAATCALQSLHPQIKDFLMLSATARSVEVVSVKRGHIVDAVNGTEGTDALLGRVRKLSLTADDALPTSRQPGYIAPKPKEGSKTAQDEARKEWVASFVQLLKGCAARHALPRTIFMIADEEAREALTAALNDETLHALWLSDEPVTIVALTTQHVSSAITTTGTAEGNVALALLAVFATQQ